MNQVEFLRIVGEVRSNCGLECTGANYYIFIHKDLNRVTVNRTGYVSMVNIAYVIVVSAYNWKNMGYVNTSLTQLLMVDNAFEPVENISFGIWNFKGLMFVPHRGQYYNAWRPVPMLELSDDPSVNNFEARPWDEPDPFPEWEWPHVTIENISELFKSVTEFARTHTPCEK